MIWVKKTASLKLSTTSLIKVSSPVVLWLLQHSKVLSMVGMVRGRRNSQMRIEIWGDFLSALRRFFRPGCTTLKYRSMEVTVRKAMLAPRFKNNMKSIALHTTSFPLLLSPWMKLYAFMGKQKSRRMSANTKLKRKTLLVLDFQNFSLNMKRWRTDALRGKAKMKITIMTAA